jgi:hypothetical protein
MKLIVSRGLGKASIDDLYEQVQAEIATGSDLYLGLVPFGYGIGQCVGGENYANLEYQLIAEKDGEAFNSKLADYLAHGWLPHMGPTPWHGYFMQWVCRERAMAVGVMAMSERRPLPVTNVVEAEPALHMVVKTERLLMFPLGSVPSILSE